MGSGVREEAVFVLKHGLEFPKFNLSVPPSAVLDKGFRILFNGGLLPRKVLPLDLQP